MAEKFKFRHRKIIREKEEEIEKSSVMKKEETEKEGVEHFRAMDIEILSEISELEEHLIIPDTTLEEIESKTQSEEVYDPVILQMDEFNETLYLPDTTLTQEKPASTNLIQPSDIFLVAYENSGYGIIKELDTSLNEDFLVEEVKENARFMDILLQDEILEENEKLENLEVNTELEIVMEDLLAEMMKGGNKMKEELFEELVKADSRFPRGFSETANRPIVILLGEEKYDWHTPLLYALKELFREISERPPKIIFRRAENYESGENAEKVDSIDLESLERFEFEYHIEFLDARGMLFSLHDFVDMVSNRLKSAFLQQFGILLVAIDKKDLEKAKEGILKYIEDKKKPPFKLYTLDPENKEEITQRYQEFLSKLLGMPFENNYFAMLDKYEEKIERSLIEFSSFVKRGLDKTTHQQSDRFQYPLKVAVFHHLINKILRNERREEILNEDKLYSFISEVLDERKIIEIEEKLDDGGNVIPDIIYKTRDGRKICIEIETLIGTIEPLKKVDESVEKYFENNLENHVDSIWIVLRPVSALWHYGELRKRTKIYRHRFKDLNVEFKVLSLVKTNKEGELTWNLLDLSEYKSLKGYVKR